MRFIDEVTIRIRGGSGGAGLVGWRREKYEPMGGPDGGDGGNGGAVIFVADAGLNTLIDFSFNRNFSASDGTAGGSNQKAGADGEDLVRPVPLGTQVFFRDKLVADLSVEGARWVAARGGHGGKGNAHFKHSTNQAPDYAQPGQPGDEVELRLVLKSVADVGLVGLPNVGKSTLISRISRAHPKVADYPFTTLEPHLGVVVLPGDRKFVVADLPGLIPGAHEGKGLGIQFLKHIERTSVLAHLVDLSRDVNLSDESPDEEILRSAREQLSTIEHELIAFSDIVAALPRILVFSKGDLAVNRRAFELVRREGRKLHCFLISSVTGEGIDELSETLFDELKLVKAGSYK